MPPEQGTLFRGLKESSGPESSPGFRRRTQFGQGSGSRGEETGTLSSLSDVPPSVVPHPMLDLEPTAGQEAGAF